MAACQSFVYKLKRICFIVYDCKIISFPQIIHGSRINSIDLCQFIHIIIDGILFPCAVGLSDGPEGISFFNPDTFEILQIRTRLRLHIMRTGKEASERKLHASISKTAMTPTMNRPALFLDLLPLETATFLWLLVTFFLSAPLFCFS